MDIGAPELLVILVILLLIMGPGKLAGLGGSLGRSIREFRQAVQGEDAHPGRVPAQVTSETVVAPGRAPAPTIADQHDPVGAA